MMKTFRRLRALGGKHRSVFLAAGFFDGIHLGHRKVIDRTIAAAREAGGEAWILSFNTHPMSVLSPADAPKLLTSMEHKLRVLRRLDLEGCILLPFTRRLADMDPAEFVMELAGSCPTLEMVVVGRNWRFGRRGAGDARLLRRLGRDLGFATTVVAPVVRDGEPVSSTRIRSLIARGRLDQAARMLGRPVGIFGAVYRDRQLGRKLGFPTANLDSQSELLPPGGVYAVHALVGNRLFDGVLNLGTRPTFGRASTKLSAELHLLDVNMKLYGRKIEVFFAKRLRKERTFSSHEQLMATIARDTRHARRFFADGHSRERLRSCLDRCE